MPKKKVCVKNCKGFVKCYRFPSSDEKRKVDKRREIWMQRLGVPPTTSKKLFACNKHFSHHMICSSNLKWDAVPDLNLHVVETASKKKQLSTATIATTASTASAPKFTLSLHSTQTTVSDCCTNSISSPHITKSEKKSPVQPLQMSLEPKMTEATSVVAVAGSAVQALNKSMNPPQLPTCAQRIAELCIEKFRTLPKSGKPTSREWTVLAGVVQHNAALAANTASKVVALGAGTKCIGENKSRDKNKNGCILNDSHAEVLARRALLRYFYQQLKNAAATDAATAADSIFTWNDASNLFELRPDISFHFLSTKTPCGDACIVADAAAAVSKESAMEKPQQQQRTEKSTAPCEFIIMKKTDYEQEQQDLKDEIKRLQEDVDCLNACVLHQQKRRKIGHSEFDDVVMPSSSIRTGAKLIGAHHQDPMHQRVGALRVKPGRGDRTQSMSCSDKLAKWNVMGVQGALLHSLLEQPIYFESLTFAGDRDSDKESLERAIYGRFPFTQRNFQSANFKAQQPEIRICAEATFEYAQQPPPDKDGADSRTAPSPNGLAWCAVEEALKPYEVSVNGIRQGTNYKHPNKTKIALKISKYFLLREFVDLITSSKAQHFIEKFSIKSGDDFLHMPYADFKQSVETYQAAWMQVRRDYFQEWTKKPTELSAFSLADNCL